MPTNACTDTRSCGPAGGQLRHRPNTQGRALAGPGRSPGLLCGPRVSEGGRLGRASSRGGDSGVRTRQAAGGGSFPSLPAVGLLLLEKALLT